LITYSNKNKKINYILWKNIGKNLSLIN
jgi:hypothetical protein